jgi:hypothetical protein
MPHRRKPKVTKKNGLISGSGSALNDTKSKSQLITTDLRSIDEKIESVLRYRNHIPRQFKNRVYSHETIAGVCPQLPHVIVNEIVDYAIGIYPEQLLFSGVSRGIIIDSVDTFSASVKKVTITKNASVVDSPIEYTKDPMLQIKHKQSELEDVLSVISNVPKTDFMFGWRFDCSHAFSIMLNYKPANKNMSWDATPGVVILQIDGSSVQILGNGKRKYDVGVTPVSVTISVLFTRYLNGSDFKLSIVPFG